MVDALPYNFVSAGHDSDWMEPSTIFGPVYSAVIQVSSDERLD